tara:strand:+ start:214 stop:1299 length:1086 start_codon:yes stop_codon:yes gene_type:complete
MKVIYIAETSLTNKSAYTQHVVKMCDAFAQNNTNLTLLVPFEKNDLKFKNLKKKFLLNSKKTFLIKSIIRSNINNFLLRIKFAFRVCNFVKNQKPDLIITRSLISSFFLSLMRIFHFLEIHNEPKSFTKFLMINLNFINSKYIKKVILISNSLGKKFSLKKKNVLILHDGVDVKNFNKFKIIKKIKIATYVGSFYKGRGIEIINQLAYKFKDVKFRLYGQKQIKLNLKTQNIKFFGHMDYNKVPSILAKSDVLLMPYANKVFIRAKNINTANYCSPLKMFDYLASGKIILSSKLDGICEVLKHNNNAIIVKNYTIEEWSKVFNDLLNNKYNLRKLQKKSIETAEKFTWNKRVLKIIGANKK